MIAAEQQIRIKRHPPRNQLPDEHIVTLNLQDLSVCSLLLFHT